MTRTLMCSLCILVMADCTTGTEDNADPEISVVDGKADFAETMTISYGETLTGQVNGHAFSLFELSVEGADQFDVIVRQISGDFEPRSVVYTQDEMVLEHVTGSFETLDDGNRKTFVADDNATSLFVLVRANYYRGSGDFEMTVTCTGGPCAGGVEPVGGDFTMAGICITRARECAMARLESETVNSLVESVELLATCFDQDASCDRQICDLEARDGATPRELCNGIASSLTFYARESTECRRQHTSCMDDCLQYEENSHFLEYGDDEFEFWMTGEAICWLNRYGTSCDEFAQGHTDCGGNDYLSIDGVETSETCESYWRATEGAWNEYDDDIMDCSHVCDRVFSVCNARCDSEPPSAWDECFFDCFDNHDLNDIGACEATDYL